MLCAPPPTPLLSPPLPPSFPQVRSKQDLPQGAFGKQLEDGRAFKLYFKDEMRERAVSMAARLEAPGDDDPGVTRARKLALLRGHNATTTAPFAYPDGINDAPLECLYDEWEWEQRESTAAAKRASDATRRETLDTFVAERKVSLVGARRPLALPLFVS